MNQAQVVIAVHTADRPIERAVSSVVDHNHNAHVIVVVHNTDPAPIAAKLAGFDRNRVTILPFRDGIPSPAGPFNAGIAQVTAEFFAIMGSDDFLEAGAIDYLIAARAEGSNVVVMPMRHQTGALVPAPLPRFGRSTGLKPGNDRLFYRTAPLALIRTTVWKEAGIGLIERIRSGEDLAAGAWLWSSAGPVQYLRRAPAYVIGADAEQRVTGLKVPLEDLLTPVRITLDEPWITRLLPPDREALVRKLVRVQVLAVLTERGHAPTRESDTGAKLLARDVMVAIDLISHCDELAPGWNRPLSRRDRNLIDDLVKLSATSMATSRDLDAMFAAFNSHRQAGLGDRLLPRKLAAIFNPDSQLRRLVAAKIATHTARIRGNK